jgi:uncharacterized membrane protein
MGSQQDTTRHNRDFFRAPMSRKDVGTLGGRALRARMADAFRRDLPAAVIEDLIAIAGAAIGAFALR